MNMGIKLVDYWHFNFKKQTGLTVIQKFKTVIQRTPFFTNHKRYQMLLLPFTKSCTQIQTHA